MSESETVIGFVDESASRKGRYQSLALLTATVCVAGKLKDRVSTVASPFHDSEIKWTDVNRCPRLCDRCTSCRRCTAVGDLVSAVIEFSSRYSFRVDTLIWDHQDRRHTLRGRDDLANRENMLATLFNNVRSRSYQSVLNWELRIDQDLAQSLEHVTNAAAVRAQSDAAKFPASTLGDWGPLTLARVPLTEVSSELEPLVQVCDLFAGIAAFSYGLDKGKLRQFKAETDYGAGVSDSGRQFMDALAGGSVTLSNGERGKLGVYETLLKACAAKGYVVDHDASTFSKEGEREVGGLCTPAWEAGKQPINFWFYNSTKSFDKAPTKDNRKAWDRQQEEWKAYWDRET